MYAYVCKNVCVYEYACVSVCVYELLYKFVVQIKTTKRSVMGRIVMRKMSWMMDWKWMNMNIVRRLWEMCGEDCGSC